MQGLDQDYEKEIIKIPVSSLVKGKSVIIRIGEKEKEVDMSTINRPICHHYLKWIQLGKISRKMLRELL